MLNRAGGAFCTTGALKEEQMKTAEILSAFGLTLWRSYGQWFACRPTEGPAFAEHSAKSTRGLVEMIVPRRRRRFPRRQKLSLPGPRSVRLLRMAKWTQIG